MEEQMGNQSKRIDSFVSRGIAYSFDQKKNFSKTFYD
jgi:hypothetical protein